MGLLQWLKKHGTLTVIKRTVFPKDIYLYVCWPNLKVKKNKWSVIDLMSFISNWRTLHVRCRQTYRWTIVENRRQWINRNSRWIVFWFFISLKKSTNTAKEIIWDLDNHNGDKVGMVAMVISILTFFGRIKYGSH